MKLATSKNFSPTLFTSNNKSSSGLIPLTSPWIHQRGHPFTCSKRHKTSKKKKRKMITVSPVTRMRFSRVRAENSESGKDRGSAVNHAVAGYANSRGGEERKRGRERWRSRRDLKCSSPEERGLNLPSWPVNSRLFSAPYGPPYLKAASTPITQFIAHRWKWNLTGCYFKTSPPFLDETYKCQRSLLYIRSGDIYRAQSARNILTREMDISSTRLNLPPYSRFYFYGSLVD